jgi:3-hydroxyisobutyryl-CoA hydrolase
VFYLNRPKKLNALNTEMVDLLTDSVDNWSESRLAKIMIARGKGPKAFCAGGDIAREYT